MQVSNSIKSSNELRAISRNQLKGHWGTAVLLCLVFMILTTLAGTVPAIGMIVNLLVSGPLLLGYVSCFLKLIRKEPFRFENLFDGFSNFKSAFLAYLLMTIFTVLWTLLFLIPGIIAILRYSMTFYILHDHPNIGALEAIRTSKEMMIGYKWKLFCLFLSFWGWIILSILTLGIGFLWLTPYIQTAITNFYQELKSTQANLLESKSQEKDTVTVNT
ncbi:DUF975 family protein [Halocella sp. SP3-1]|uniref:DUF975 family protein n=1 Tax=Halocella sp. SP3-1 TaxID=2382161 RepID=UPI000F761A87|nr:DUF975 family protein [Halocella sp. SP3-1]AZO95435.1 DUF975 family protein [Halocella sp. SP3-1]